MTKYHFMWGQKQSAMIAEAMLFEMMHTLTSEGKFVPSTINECLNIIVDGIYANYMPDSAIENWRKNGKEYCSKEFSLQLFKDMDKFIDVFFAFCKDLQKKNLSALSNAELKQILLNYQNFLNRTFIYFGTSSPQGTFMIEQKMRKILKEKIANEDTVNDYFISLCTPSEMDDTMNERLDFLQLAEKKEISQKDLEIYSQTYPALFFNTYSKKEVNEFLNYKLQEETGKSFAQEFERINNHLDQIKKKHSVIHTLMQNEELMTYSIILQKSGLYRYRLKHVWSGAEYLCLDMIYELQKRIGIAFNDFITTYFFSDIILFLDTNQKVSPEEIQRRKKCMVLHYISPIVHRYSGQEALAYKDKLITEKKEAREQREQNLKGVIANKGVVRANARVVNVKDLRSFSKDSAAFQKGEILVTTMTSPLMVPLIEKAAGIITDEGGICSHASVISREFNIPCIVGTKGASFVIKTGDLVELNANTGQISIIEKQYEPTLTL